MGVHRMASVLDVLREINQTRLELTDIRDQIRRAPLQLKSREAELQKMKDRIATEKESAKKIRVDADSRELTLKQAESRIKDLRGKLNQCDSNKEYQAIQDEINRITRENDALQDAILVRITEEEAKREEVKTLETQLAQMQEDFDKFKGVVDYKSEKLKGQVEILSSKLKELEPQLSDSLGDYQRLTAVKGDEALAECINGNCQGCFSEQPPQSWQELLNGRPTKCRFCGALLFKS
jgi:predicted  nucleic acid-binding Zn-ribbon protein